MLPETQFYIRVFPSPNKDWSNVKLDVNKKVHVRSIEDLKRGKLGSNIFWQFKTDGVLVNVSQEEFYKAVLTEELLKKLLKGFDLVILCFGSSGTGKTYSALGLYNRYEYRGLAPRLLEDLFKLKEENNNLFKMDIYLTYVEIIGKNIHNLLVKDKPIILKSGSKTYNVSLGIHLDNVCLGMKVLFDADDRRNFENENSHCGTSIITFEIVCVSLLTSSPVITVTKVHIIDTAGTDFGSKLTKSMKCHINANLTKSDLNTLCSWVQTKGENSNRNFSQRGSVMTLYLGSSITKGYTRYLGHIKTSNDDLSYSMSTLLFGTRLRKLQSPLLVRAKTRNSDLIIKGLQEQINEMKDNAISKTLIRGTFMPETISQEQMDFVMRDIRHFLSSVIGKPCLLAKAHPLVLLKGLKNIYLNDMKEAKDLYTKLLEEKESALRIAQDRLRNIRPSSSTSHSSTRSFRRKSPSKSSSNVSPAPTSADIHEQDQQQQQQQQQQQTPDTKTDYSFGKLSLESEAAGEENYAKTFNEFLTKSPYYKARIKLYETDIEEGFKEKCDLQSKLTDMKYEINLLRMELNKEEWNTFNRSLEQDTCTRGGRVLEKSFEQETLEKEIENKVEEYNVLRLSLFAAHNKYMGATFMLNETRVDAEKQFNEYVKNMYNNVLLLPPVKRVAFDKNIQTDIILEEVSEEEVVSKKCFYKLQRKPIKGK